MSQLHLMRSRRFWPLFWTQFFGAFNDNLFKNALVILIAFHGVKVMGIAPAQMVPFAGGIFILPFFLFSATAGQWADQQEKSRLVRWIKLFEILIMGLATGGFLAHRFAFLLVVLFLMGVHSTFFGPIKYSILPQLLKEGDLVEANALIEAGTFLSILLGTILGGVLIGIDRDGPAYISLALLAVAIVGWLSSRALPQIPAMDPALRVQWNPFPPTLAIFRSTRRNRPVWLAVVGISWFWFYGAAMLSLFPGYCRETLGAGEGTVTLFLALFSVGVGVGSLLCGKLSRGKISFKLVGIGLLGLIVCTAELWRLGRPPSFAPGSASSPFMGSVLGVTGFLSEPAGLWISAVLFLLSACGGLFIVPLYALMQEQAEPSQRSRVIAANNVLNALFMVGASGLLMGLLGAGFSVPGVFGILALLNGAAGVWLVISQRSLK